MALAQLSEKTRQVKPLAAQFQVRRVRFLVEIDELVRQPGMERPADSAILEGWADLARVRKGASPNDLKRELTVAEP